MPRKYPPHPPIPQERALVTWPQIEAYFPELSAKQWEKLKPTLRELGVVWFIVKRINHNAKRKHSVACAWPSHLKAFFALYFRGNPHCIRSSPTINPNHPQLLNRDPRTTLRYVLFPSSPQEEVGGGVVRKEGESEGEERKKRRRKETTMEPHTPD